MVPFGSTAENFSLIRASIRDLTNFYTPERSLNRLMGKVINMSAVTASASAVQAQFLPPQEGESKVKLSTEIEIREEVTVVHCYGRLVYRDEAAALRRTVEGLLPQAQHIVLDLRGVETIDGAGLGHLLAALHKAKASGGTLHLASPSRRTLNLLQLTNLDSVFEIYPVLEDAVLVSRWQIA
jgi:anti-sigma B factor antagonist